MIGSKLTERKTNEKRTNHDNYPSPALPVSTISGNIPSAGRTAEASEENASDIESITYVEGSIGEIRQDQQLQAMARTIQNMGELLVIFFSKCTFLPPPLPGRHIYIFICFCGFPPFR